MSGWGMGSDLLGNQSTEDAAIDRIRMNEDIRLTQRDIKQSLVRQTSKDIHTSAADFPDATDYSTT